LTHRIRAIRIPQLALCLILGGAAGCASTGAVPAPFPRPAPPAIVPELGPGGASAVVGTALSLRGVPYRDGGSDPSGFDCSGLVAYVFARHGLLLPRAVTGQFSVGEAVGNDALAPGDLVFFSTVAPGPSHVGIAISPQEFVHAPSSSGVVRVESLGSSYWSSRFLGARRLR
jgi:cell wall-associated NlpC family hydrolase